MAHLANVHGFTKQFTNCESKQAMLSLFRMAGETSNVKMLQAEKQQLKKIILIITNQRLYKKLKVISKGLNSLFLL